MFSSSFSQYGHLKYLWIIALSFVRKSWNLWLVSISRSCSHKESRLDSFSWAKSFLLTELIVQLFKQEPFPRTRKCLIFTMFTSSNYRIKCLVMYAYNYHVLLCIIMLKTFLLYSNLVGRVGIARKRVNVSDVRMIYLSLWGINKCIYNINLSFIIFTIVNGNCYLNIVINISCQVFETCFMTSCFAFISLCFLNGKDFSVEFMGNFIDIDVSFIWVLITSL